MKRIMHNVIVVFLLFIPEVFLSQITFVDVNPDSCICVSSTANVSKTYIANLDLNNDAVNDFYIEVVSNYMDCNHGWQTSALKAYGANSIAGDAPTSGYNSAFMLNSGDTINTQTSWVNSSWLRYYDLFSGFHGTYWITSPGVFKFAGVKFYSGTTLYYGWLSLNVLVNCGFSNVILSEYAYSTSIIKVGQTGYTSVFESSFKGTTIYPNPANEKVSLNNAANNYYDKIIIENGLGEKMSESILNMGLNDIDIQFLPSGLYFYTLFRNGETSKAGKLVIE